MANLESINQSLDLFRQDIADRGNLAAYATSDALGALFENWKVALAEGHKLSSIALDVTDIMSYLTEFASKLQKLEGYDEVVAPKVASPGM